MQKSLRMTFELNLASFNTSSGSIVVSCPDRDYAVMGSYVQIKESGPPLFEVINSNTYPIELKAIRAGTTTINAGPNVEKFYRNDNGDIIPLGMLHFSNTDEITVEWGDPTPTPAPATPEPPLCGDVYINRSVDIVDALMVAQYYVGILKPLAEPRRADVNNDGSITIVDSLMIAQYYTGLITDLDCGDSETIASLSL